MKTMLASLFFLATIVATCHGLGLDHGATYQIHPLRLKSGAGGSYHPGMWCRSWQLGVEAHNIIEWDVVPEECGLYVGNYMLGPQYREDSKVVAREAFLYAWSQSPEGDGRDIWVFDIDETSLSHLPYFAEHGFGTQGINGTAVLEWMEEGKAPALPESLKLYNKLLSLGYKVVFMTGRSESLRSSTVANLKRVGYHNWEKLILKDSSYSGKTTGMYKSAERKKLEEEEGYRIIGNVGDQWSDILGNNIGKRTFKLPNPMYYVE